MGQYIQLAASDDFTLDAYRADPSGDAKAGLVVIQEIFGVNAHIRELCDRYAAEGYSVIAPALFDRAEKNVELGYEQADREQGMALRAKCPWDSAVMDVEAAAAVLRAEGKVGVVGYCWGGSLTWLSACRSDIDAAVCYYGGQIFDFREEKPKVQVLMHFGEKDASIPMEKVEAINADYPDIPSYVYDDAQHGFSCDHRGSYQEAAHVQALERTLAFFDENL